jgi:hypothetical protein
VARLFRFLEKKRGKRRTGSKFAGNVGEALFFSALFLVGAGTISAALSIDQPTDAKVAAAIPRVETKADGKSSQFASDSDKYALGKGQWLILLVGGSFATMGGAGLIWTAVRLGISAERRSIMARSATELDPLSDILQARPDYPATPEVEGLKNSPGVELSFRLPQSQSVGWRLVAATVFALTWNAVACVIAVGVVRGHLVGQHDWLFTAFSIPFLAVGGWSIYYLLRQIVIQTGMGPTTVEVSDLPLYSGRDYRVAVWQQGHIRVVKFEVCLVCEEEATYHQGTDCRTEVREVQRFVVFEQGDFLIEPSQPFQCSFLLSIPPDAMHSFQGAHNSVQWRLVVRGSAEGWPEFRRAFSLVVYPGAAASRAQITSPAGRANTRALSTVLRSAGARA